MADNNCHCYYLVFEWNTHSAPIKTLKCSMSVLRNLLLTSWTSPPQTISHRHLCKACFIFSNFHWGELVKHFSIFLFSLTFSAISVTCERSLFFKCYCDFMANIDHENITFVFGKILAKIEKEIWEWTKIEGYFHVQT